MFERYSEQAMFALFHARSEASQTGSREVGLPHLVIGILEARNAELVTGIDLAPFREILGLNAVPADQAIPMSVEMRFQDDVVRVLEAAGRDSEGASVDVQDLLRALFKLNPSGIAVILRELKVEP